MRERKRHRAAALQNLADGMACSKFAPASWSAAALCRFRSLRQFVSRDAARRVRSDWIHRVGSTGRAIAPSIKHVRSDILNIYGRARLETFFLRQQLFRSRNSNAGC